MYRRLIVVGLFVSILSLVFALGCTGPVGPAGSPGLAGPAGPPAPAVPVPVVVASPTSVAIAADNTSNLGGVTFTGAGWDTETALRIEILLPDGKWQTLAAAAVTKEGAFIVKGKAENNFTVAAGTYTIRATGKNTGKVAFVPFTISPKPK